MSPEDCTRDQGVMTKRRSPIPSVDEVLRCARAQDMIARFGHKAVVGAARKSIEAYRAARRSNAGHAETREAGVEAITSEALTILHPGLCAEMQ